MNTMISMGVYNIVRNIGIMSLAMLSVLPQMPMIVLPMSKCGETLKHGNTKNSL